MRVLHVVRQFHPMVGGMEQVVQCLAKRQRALGIDAEVLTLDRLFTAPALKLKDRDLVDGIPVTRIPFFGGRRLFIAPRILSHLRGVDLVHVHGVDFFCDALAMTMRAHRKPLVLSTHGGFFHTEYANRVKEVYFKTITRATLSRFRAIIASSDADRDRFSKICDERLTTITNGVDASKFRDAGSREYKPTFITIGRMSSNKRLVDLIDTFSIVATSIPEAKLHIVGADFDGLLPQLRDHAAHVPGGDRIAFHPGLDDAALSRLLGECCFFVSASRYEGFGLTLVEAMSAGLVPIVQGIPTFTSIVNAAGVGRLTDYSEPDGAAADIVEYVRDARGMYPAWRAAAKKSSIAYSWESAERRFFEVYERVLGTRTRNLLGVHVSVMRRSEAVDAIDYAISEGRPLNVAFANANTLNIASSDTRARESLNNCLVLNDGLGADIASQLKYGRRFEENLNGTDFVPHYLGASQHALRIYLLGASEDAVRGAALAIGSRWSRHIIVGWHHGYFNAEEMSELCERIRSSSPDLLLVALGNPVQELWIERYGDLAGATVRIGVGALFDFLSGRKRRAPRWMRYARCEWLFRFLLEPRRLATRYVNGTAAFLARAVRDSRRGSNL